MKKYILNYFELFESSELSKYGVPKEMINLIHSLSGGEKITNPYYVTSRKLKLPNGLKYVDDPISHDIKLLDTIIKKDKTDNSIYEYLESLEPENSYNLLLITPYYPNFYFIYYKSAPISNVTSMSHYRVITIDENTGKPISKWAGNIHTLLKNAGPGSILYVFEKEERAKIKKQKREEEKNYTDDKFIDFFIKSFNNILDKAFGKSKEYAKRKFYEKLLTITPEDVSKSLDKETYMDYTFPTSYIQYPGKKDYIENKESWEKFIDLIDLSKMINRGFLKREDLLNEFKKFKKHMMEESLNSYKEDNEDPHMADLNDLIRVNGLMGLSNAFLQYIVTGKTFSIKDRYEKFFL